MTTFNLNGKSVTVKADENTPLLWVLRDELNYTGTKYGCGMALCGACTVHIDGQPSRSCSMPLSTIAGKNVRTIESIGDQTDKVGVAVQKAWNDMNVVQCGYCQSGQIMSAVALLQQNKKPSDQDIDTAMSGNICRCATYQRVRAAIHTAAKSLGA